MSYIREFVGGFIEASGATPEYFPVTFALRGRILEQVGLNDGDETAQLTAVACQLLVGFTEIERELLNARAKSMELEAELIELRTELRNLKSTLAGA